MSTRNDRFNTRLRTIDWTNVTDDQSKDPRISDRGVGTGRLYAALDFGWTEELAGWSAAVGDRNACVVGAVLRLVWAGKGHLVPALLANLENGPNVSASLRRMPKSTYFRLRKALLEFFRVSRADIEMDQYLRA